MIKYFLILFIVAQYSCKQTPKQVATGVVKKDSLKTVAVITKKKDTLKEARKYYTQKEITNFKDDTFIVLKKLDSTFFYNMKYATADNFLKEKVYDCANCLVRYETAKKLIKANADFKKIGFRIQFFDCYRPLAIQKKMWKIFPDKRYVANPLKGSNHNRGTAVDITLVDSFGVALPMGTKFDFFGRKAHHAYQNLPKEVLINRKLLKTTMIKNGFWAITSEWWHYNLNKSQRYAVSNFKTKCE